MDYLTVASAVDFVVTFQKTFILLYKTWSRKEKVFHTVEPEGCLWCIGIWHLCAAMGWAESETNTVLLRRQTQTPIQLQDYSNSPHTAVFSYTFLVNDFATRFQVKIQFDHF